MASDPPDALRFEAATRLKTSPAKRLDQDVPKGLPSSCPYNDRRSPAAARCRSGGRRVQRVLD